MLHDLGINSASINYEVALEVLGQSRQPFMEAIRLEKGRDIPSLAYIHYCEARLAAIDELQSELQPSDESTITKILDKNNGLLRA